MPTTHDQPLGETGWARRWLDTLGGFSPENAERLARGSHEARAGNVLQVVVGEGVIEALVDRKSTYVPAHVTIAVARLSDTDWQKVAAALAGRAHLAARLLAGEVPLEITEVFAALGLALLPRIPSELTATCTCRQGQKLCPHVAAVHYVLATNLEHQPFLLFTLRGRALSEVLDDMRALWKGGQPRDESADERALPPADQLLPPPAPLRAANFYRAGPALDALRITVAPPQVEAALLKRLGRPPFAAPDEDPLPALTSVYAAVTRRALATQGRTERRAPGQSSNRR
jgi:uncharacterized Zn finger protein